MPKAISRAKYRGPHSKPAGKREAYFMKNFLSKFTRQELSWMMYDWANSAHSVIVVTLLPIFFDSVAKFTADSVSSISTWGYATSIAMAIVALSAPFLGVFGDIRGMRKKLFTVFLLVGVAAVAGLAFTPGMDFTSSPTAAGRVAALILVLYILSVVGFNASCIYYDAFLTDVTTEDRIASVNQNSDGSGTLVFQSGATLNFSNAKSMTATSYTAGHGGADSCTATGTFVRKGVVAVDKNVIPLGTKMYIVASDGSVVYGMAVAEDTGVRGNKVDLYYDTYQQCINFGRRTCTVYILE